jgi:hypothetical protein
MTIESILDYLKKFYPRQDKVVVDGAKVKIYPAQEQDDEKSKSEQKNAVPTIRYNEVTCENLEINELLEEILKHDQIKTRESENTIKSGILYPLYDKSSIEIRQKVFEKLTCDSELLNQTKQIERNLFEYIHGKNRKNNFKYDTVEELEKVNSLVSLIDSINDMKELNFDSFDNNTLVRIKSFGTVISNDTQYQKVAKFIKRIYRPYEIGQNIDELLCDINCRDPERISNKIPNRSKLRGI